MMNEMTTMEVEEGAACAGESSPQEYVAREEGEKDHQEPQDYCNRQQQHHGQHDQENQLLSTAVLYDSIDDGQHGTSRTALGMIKEGVAESAADTTDTTSVMSGSNFHPSSSETDVDSQQQQQQSSSNTTRATQEVQPGAFHISYHRPASNPDYLSRHLPTEDIEEANDTSNVTTTTTLHAQCDSDEENGGPPMLEATLVDDTVVVDAQPIHDPEESKQSTSTAASKKNIMGTPTRRFFWLPPFLVLSVALAVGLGVYFGSNKEAAVKHPEQEEVTTSTTETNNGISNSLFENENAPSRRPTPSPIKQSIREDAFREVIRSSMMYSSHESLHLSYNASLFDFDATLGSISSPQSMALSWLAIQDTISPPLDPFNDTQQDRILQRYTMAVLYYSMGGDTSPSLGEDLGFLGPSHECDWKDETGSYGVKSCSSSSSSTSDIISGDDDGVQEDSTNDPTNMMRRVSSLDFAGINLSGTIPTELGRLTDLTALRFLGSDLWGTIPTELGSLPALQFLTLQGRGLVGTIPPQLGNAPLSGLWLSGNQLTGTIPSELARCPLRWGLSVRENNLSGTVPREFAGLVDLVSMEFQDNEELGGEIDFLCEGLPEARLSVTKGRVGCECCECCGLV